MEIQSETLCDIYLDNPQKEKRKRVNKKYEGILNKIGDEYEIKFKSMDSLIDKLPYQSKVYIVFGKDIGTIYEIHRYTFQFFRDFIVYKFYSSKLLVGLFSESPVNEKINCLTVSFDNLNLFFSAKMLGYNFDLKLNDINKDIESFQFHTPNFDLVAKIWHPIKSSYDFIDITTKTILDFKYRKPTEIFNAIDDLNYFITFLSFCSNNKFSYNSLAFVKNNKKIELNISRDTTKQDVTLYALNNRNIKDLTSLIDYIYKEKMFFQNVFRLYYDTCLQNKEKLPSATEFTKWVALLEYIYNKFFDKVDKTEKFKETFKQFKEIIKDSKELSTEQKDSLPQQIIGLIDNPLKEKILAIFEFGNGVYYNIKPSILKQDSSFIKKIIATRNSLTHPRETQKDVFNPIEICKLNCFFKNIVFIVICKKLGNIKFTDYYYEKIKFFYDLIKE